MTDHDRSTSSPSPPPFPWEAVVLDAVAIWVVVTVGEWWGWLIGGALFVAATLVLLHRYVPNGLFLRRR